MRAMFSISIVRFQLPDIAALPTVTTAVGNKMGPCNAASRGEVKKNLRLLLRQINVYPPPPHYDAARF